MVRRDGLWVFTLFLSARFALTFLPTAISTCITNVERMEVIENASQSFDHYNQSQHDEEIAIGADAALTKHLVFLSWKIQTCNDDRDHQEILWNEVGLVCGVFELIYRASEPYVEASFMRLGKDLLQVLLSLLNQQLHGLLGERGSTRDSVREPHGGAKRLTPTGETFVKKGVKLIANFARIGKATTPLATFPHLLQLLIDMTQSRPDNVPWEARLSALWIIGNLACDQNNMQLLVQTPGLVASLVGVCCRPLHPGASLEETMEILRARSTATRAIANLAWDNENKATLEEYPGLVEMLAELSVHRDHPLKKSRTIRDVMTNTRRYAVAAIRSLAAAPKPIKVKLCNHQQGRLLDILTDAALYDKDKQVKDKAIAAIHALASQATADAIVNHPALVLLLKDTLLSEEEAGFTQDGEAPRSHALATLTILERSITKEMPSYGNLKTLLEVVNKEDSDEMDDVQATAV